MMAHPKTRTRGEPEEAQDISAIEKQARVANKMINGKQCTMLLHVDDLKISHTDPDVVTSSYHRHAA